MHALTGLLFGPGLPAAGVPVPARVDALQLSLQMPDGHGLATPLAALQLRKAGFNEAQWELSWNQGDQRWALLVADAAAMQALLRDPPAGLATAAGRLQQQGRRRRIRRGLGWSAVLLWLGLPLLLIVALLMAAQPLAGALSAWVPVKTEHSLGEWAFKAQSARLKLIQDRSANHALAAIGQRLVGSSAYTYRWYIARDASLNAFAMPGGIIVVHSGLIEAADSAEELAGVLAHEIEHVEQRHSLKAMLQQAGLRLAIAAVIGDIGLAGEAAGRLSGLSFSRDNEREADRLGLARLQAAEIDPQGMLRLFAKLGADKGIKAPDWLSSHPAIPQRIESLQSAIGVSKATPIRPLDLDWPAVRTSLREPTH